MQADIVYHILVILDSNAVNRGRIADVVATEYTDLSLLTIFFFLLFFSLNTYAVFMGSSRSEGPLATESSIDDNNCKFSVEATTNFHTSVL